jgi:hypothetical protein
VTLAPFDLTALRYYRAARGDGWSRGHARDMTRVDLEARTYTCGTCGHRWSFETPAARCPLEADHPEPLEPTLADRLRAAMRPLIALRDEALDVDDADDLGEAEAEAAAWLERAFDYLDLTVSALEPEDLEPDELGALVRPLTDHGCGCSSGALAPWNGGTFVEACADCARFTDDDDAAGFLAGRLGLNVRRLYDDETRRYWRPFLTRPGSPGDHDEIGDDR